MEPAPAFCFFSRGTLDERLQESLPHDNVSLGRVEIADSPLITANFPDTDDCSPI